MKITKRRLQLMALLACLPIAAAVVARSHVLERFGIGAPLRVKVDLSERRLYVIEGGEVVETYGVAIGTRSHPTPTGSFHRGTSTGIRPGIRPTRSGRAVKSHAHPVTRATRCRASRSTSASLRTSSTAPTTPARSAALRLTAACACVSAMPWRWRAASPVRAERRSQYSTRTPGKRAVGQTGNGSIRVRYDSIPDCPRPPVLPGHLSVRTPHHRRHFARAIRPHDLHGADKAVLFFDRPHFAGLDDAMIAGFQLELE